MTHKAFLKKSSPDVFRQLLGLGFASVHLAYFHPKIKIIEQQLVSNLTSFEVKL